MIQRYYLKEQFETNLTELLEKIKKAFRTRLMLIEPFLLPTDPEKKSSGRISITGGEVVRRLARKYADAYLHNEWNPDQQPHRESAYRRVELRWRASF